MIPSCKSILAIPKHWKWFLGEPPLLPQRCMWGLLARSSSNPFSYPSWRQKRHLLPSSLQEPLPIAITFQKLQKVAPQWHQPALSALTDSTVNLYTSSLTSLFKCSLTWFSSTDGRSYLLQTSPLVSGAWYLLNKPQFLPQLTILHSDYLLQILRFP